MRKRSAVHEKAGKNFYEAVSWRLHDFCSVTYAYILEISDVLTAIADGDLTPALKQDYIGSYSPIKMAINTILENLNQTLMDVKLTVDHVASGAEQISASAMALADGSQRQTFPLISLINSSVDEIANVVTSTSATAEESASAAEELSATSDLLRQKVAFFKLSM